MGALPFEGGTAFRVWAHASAVHVVGTFNDWSQTAAPLTAESTRYWSPDVTGAKVDNEYKFVLTNPDVAGPIWNDPYARSMNQSNGKSVIAGTDYVWTSRNCATPPRTNS